MSKKLVALFTLIAFAMLNVTCAVHTTKKVSVKTSTGWKGKNVEILGVSKISGEYIQFPKNRPARVVNDAVVGSIGPPKETEILPADIGSIKKRMGEIESITTKDGTTYNDVITRKGKIFVRKYESVSIPLTEIETVMLSKTDTALSFLATIGVLGGVLLGGLAIIALTKESCPFIYSFNGQKYVFDAEPYGGATSEGLKRTEWCGLQYLKEVNGEYRILMTNEVDETQHTDELELWVIDHPAGTQVVADEMGQIHTISQPIPPLRAYDAKGRSLLSQVDTNDQRFWVTPTREKNPEKKEDLKDELIFEFPKPVGAIKAKLMFNGCNTLWASQMVKRFLELYGQDVSKSYEAVKTPGPAYDLLMMWNEREELYRLQIRVETAEGWKSKGTIVGGGPFVSEDRIYSLDLRDVPDNTLRIKLTPPAAFWMVNYLAVDYTGDLPVQITEVEAAKATDGRGQDVRQLLAADDGHYLVMPYIGDFAEIVYKAPTPSKSLGRSFVIKAGGFYDIHLEAKGECQKDLLRRFLLEPGFAVQYSFNQYLEYQKDNRQKFLSR